MVYFWPQTNPGIRYVRCELPARALGAELVDLDERIRKFLSSPVARAATDPLLPEILLGELGDTAIWQLPANVLRVEAMRWLKRKGVRVLVEVDDDYSEWRDEYGAGAGWVDGTPPDDLTASVAVHRQAVEVADGVIVSTPYLADRYRELNEHVFVCRNSIDPADWDEPPARDDVLKVGWAGTIRGDWELCRKAVEYAGRQPGVEVVVFGDQQPFTRAKHLRWVDDLGEYRRKLSGLGLDVGLRPLNDVGFARAKSDLRILEYAMAGALPVVSPVEPYREWRGSPVRLPFLPKEWQSVLRDCIRNPERAASDADAVREQVIASRGPDQARADWGAVV